MLQSNVAMESGFRVYKTWSWGGTPVVSNVMCKNHRTVFTVTPSPCINNGDHKLPNAYTYTKKESWLPHGIMTSVSYPYGGSSSEGYLTEFYGYGYDVEQGLTDNTNSVNNKALAKLYEAIRGSEVSLNTTIGEGRETLQMIKPIALGAIRLIRDLKRLRKKEIALQRALLRSGKNVSDAVVGLGVSPLQTVGGFWLAWSVGLKPLLMDVENLRNHVATLRELNLDFHVDGRSAMRADDNKVVQIYERKVVITANVLDQVEYGLTLAVTDLHAFENWRLGLTVRPTLLWELTTLSFVVDYFVNVGQYLELLEASMLNNGISFRSGYKTSLRRTSALYEVSSYAVTGDKSYNSASYWTKHVTATKTRAVLTSFPAPVRPTVKIPTAASALLNCAALLAQLIKK